jgi:hypothetical protein
MVSIRFGTSENRPSTAHSAALARPALPLPTRGLRQLPGQHDFLAVFVGADDMPSQLATIAGVTASHLLFGEDGVAEEGVGGGGHLRCSR